MRRFRCFTVLLSTLVLLVAACGSANDAATTTSSAPVTDTVPTGEAALEQLITDAKAEGELMFYSTNLDVVNDAVAKAFEEKYGITTRHVPRESGPILLDRFRAERGAGGSPADVLISTSRGALDTLLADGLLEEMNPDLVPSLAALGEEAYSDSSVIVSVIPFMVCWNTDSVDGSAFKTMRDVLLPSDSNIKITTTNLQYEAYNTALDVLRQEYGLEFLQEVGDRGFTFTDSAPASQQLLIAGEADVYFMCPPSVGATSKTQGAPVDYKLVGPTSGTGLAAGIAKDGPHPAAARLFLNWLMSVEGAAVINGGGLGVSMVLPDGDAASGILPFPTEADGFTLPHNADIANVKEIYKVLGMP